MKKLSLFVLMSVLHLAGMAQGKFLKHKVKQGETIASIALKYDADKKYLLMLNDFPENVRLKQGDVVLIRELRPGEVQVMDEKEFIETSSSTYIPSTNSAPASKTAERSSTAFSSTAASVAPSSNPKAGANARAGDVVNFNGVVYQVSDDGYHVFERGQTLYRLSVIYKTSVDKLKELNGLSSNNVPVGTKLRVK